MLLEPRYQINPSIGVAAVKAGFAFIAEEVEKLPKPRRTTFFTKLVAPRVEHSQKLVEAFLPLTLEKVDAISKHATEDLSHYRFFFSRDIHSSKELMQFATNAFPFSAVNNFVDAPAFVVRKRSLLGCCGVGSKMGVPVNPLHALVAGHQSVGGCQNQIHDLKWISVNALQSHRLPPVANTI